MTILWQWKFIKINSIAGFCKMIILEFWIVIMGMGMYSHFEPVTKICAIVEHSDNHGLVDKTSKAAARVGKQVGIPELGQLTMEACTGTLQMFFIYVIGGFFALTLLNLMALFIRDLLAIVDAIYHIVAGIITLIAGSTYVAKTKELDDMLHHGVGPFTSLSAKVPLASKATDPIAKAFVEMAREKLMLDEKYLAGELAIWQGILYIAVAVIIWYEGRLRKRVRVGPGTNVEANAVNRNSTLSNQNPNKENSNKENAGGSERRGSENKESEKENEKELAKP